VRFLLSGGGLTALQLDYIRVAGMDGETGNGGLEEVDAGDFELKSATDKKIHVSCVGVDSISAVRGPGGPVNADELRRRSHLPSALARRKGHVRLAQFLSDTVL
jgi:hypothetical protein